MWPEDSASYFGDGDECHMNYHFPVMPRMFMSLQQEDRYPITDIFEQTPAIPDNCQWAVFLRNHDELTLEMVTDEERDFMYKVYAKDPKARINLGIRHRLAPLMDNNRRKIELLNSLLFSLPGTPVIYYGDEIGMGDNFHLGDRDGVRTPMQWSPDRNAGFSSANPHKLYLPLILDPEYHYESVNVETQRRNTSSLFWFMKRMINIRKSYKAFGRGDITFINVDNPKILAYLRKYEEETLLVVVNLSKYAQVAEVPLEGYKGYVLCELMSKNRFPAIGEASSYFFTLSPHTYLWFSIEKIFPGLNEYNDVPQLSLRTWTEIMHKDNRPVLETKVLPAFLFRQKWFSGRNRTIYNIEIVQHVMIQYHAAEGMLLLLEVSYESGLPEIYQLMITFAKEESAKKLVDMCPHAVIAHIKAGDEEGVLADAVYVTEYQKLLFLALLNQHTMELSETSNIRFTENGMLKKHMGKQEEIKPRMHDGDRNNTSITYDNSFFLKMYRKVDYTTNPDTEITRFLSEQVQFAYVPPYIGAIEFTSEKGTVTLGMMQVMVENHGNGQSYMMERVYNFIERILARNKESVPNYELVRTFTDPVSFEQMQDQDGLKELLGARGAAQARLIGKRTGEMHIALASAPDSKDLRPEEFSLHYQRSLYAALVSLVR